MLKKQPDEPLRFGEAPGSSNCIPGLSPIPAVLLLRRRWSSSSVRRGKMIPAVARKTQTLRYPLCVVLALGVLAYQPQTAIAQATPISEQEAHAIGVDAYLYLYPLVTMDLTRRQMTNVPAGKELGFGPPNTFNNVAGVSLGHRQSGRTPQLRHALFDCVAGSHQGARHRLRARHQRTLLPPADARHVDGCVRLPGLAHDGNASPAFPCRACGLAA